jgi:hypothetical protein
VFSSPQGICNLGESLMLLSKIQTDSSKSNIQQRIASTAIALGVGVISLTASIAPAFARSGLDLDRYCKSQYQRNGMLAWVRLNGRTVYDWSCIRYNPVSRSQQRLGINVGHACAVQRNTWDHGFTNRNDPNSWYCGR